MAYEPKENCGSLFKNDDKKKDKHPDYRGVCKLGGKEYWISGWLKKTKNDNPFQSLSFRLKDAPPQSNSDDTPF